MKISGSYENPNWYPKIRYQESLHENEIHFVPHTVPEPSMVVKKGSHYFSFQTENLKSNNQCSYDFSGLYLNVLTWFC